MTDVDGGMWASRISFTPSMASENELLAEILEISNGLMVSTEALLPFEKKATLALRTTCLAIQLDAKLMAILLSKIDKYPSNFLSFPKQPQSRENLANSLHQMRSTVGPLLEDGIIKSMADDLKGTDRKLHAPIIVGITFTTARLEKSRLELNRDFKAIWSPILWDAKSLKNSHASRNEPSPEVLKLLAAFYQHPFGIGFSEDSFVRDAPGQRRDVLPLGDYQFFIADAGIEWARHELRDTKVVDSRLLAQQDIVQLLWAGGIEVVDHVNLSAFHQPTVDFSDMAQSRQRLASSLRDSVLRTHSNYFSMVFLGAEDSGKSTFLNAFIGTEVLPAASGPTTSYPVRIRHLPGQKVSVMQLGVETLQRSIDTLKKQKWHARVLAMADKSWEGEGLPMGYDFDALRSIWERVDDRLIARLAELTARDFKFSETVTGAQNILNTLHDINDLVRICRNLPIGFDHFSPQDWPVISLEFPNLKNTYTGQDLELIDIPGFNGYTQEYEWDEMVREVVRGAKVIIPVISLRQYEFKPWRHLPRFISICTSMPASAVVLTMRDYGELDDGIIASRVASVKSLFWPLGSAGAPKGPVFVCSAKIGSMMQEMQSFLAKSKDIPKWDAFWASNRAEASEWLFPARARDIYTKATLDSLRAEVEEILSWTGLPETTDGITRIVNLSRQDFLLDESKSIVIQSKRITYDLRRMLAAVGKAQGDVATPKTEQAREDSDDAMELLDLWKLRTRDFQQKVRALFNSTTEDLAGNTEEYVEDALLQAIQNLPKDHRLPDFLQVQKAGEVDNYLRLYEDSITRYLETAEDSKAREIIGAIDSIHQSLFAQLQSKIGEIDPNIEENWKAALSEQRVPSSKITFTSGMETLEYVQKVRTAYSPMAAFSLVEQKVLSIFSTADNAEERLRNLRLGTRFLVATASALPFIITLPYWLRKSYIEAYRISMKTLRQHLLRLAVAHSDDVFGQLEEELLVQGQLESEAAIEAITSKFRIPNGYEPSNALPLLPLTQLQTVTAATANLLAATSALEWLGSVVGPSDEAANASA